jgi:predicted TIM-barrel fold metal-dependent hydrolase
VPRRSPKPLAAAVLLLLLPVCACRSKPKPPPPAALTPAVRLARIPKIDVHAHILSPAALPRALELGRPWGIVHYVNLTPGPEPAGIEAFVTAARLGGDRMTAFTALAWKEPHRGPGYGARMTAALEQAHRRGAVGVTISRGLGLAYVDHERRLVAVDDPGLDPVFEKAGALGMPVAIHTGDPRAFWQPVGPANERFDELRVHPDWSNHGEPVPSWETLLDQLARRVARHPHTRFIGVHFGNAPEDPARVAAMLDRFPNYFIDTAGRIPEIGRRPAAEMRAFFIKYQDRILFGTDLGVGTAATDLTLGSAGADPPTRAETQRFFDATFRYFETDDTDFDHPTPIQGRWRINGIHLPRTVLEKLYHRNAEKLLGIKAVTW